MQGIGSAAPFKKPSIAGLHAGIGPQMLVGVKINRLALNNQGPENSFKFMGPVDGLDARNPGGFLFAELAAFPQGDLFTGFPDKQDLPVFFIPGIRTDYQGGFFLVNAAEIKQVGLLHKRMDAVSTGGHDVIGVQNRDGARLELLGKAPAVLDEQITVNRIVQHGILSISGQRPAAGRQPSKIKKSPKSRPHSEPGCMRALITSTLHQQHGRQDSPLPGDRFRF